MRNWWRGSLASILLGMLIFTGWVNAQSGDVRPLQAEDVNDLRPLTLLDGHSAPIVEMDFSPDGNAFLTTSFDGSLCVWNVEQLGQRPGQLRLCLPNYQAGVSQFAWSPDGKYLVVSSTDTIDMYRITQVVAADNIAEFTPEISLPTTDIPLLSLEFLSAERLIAVDVVGDLYLYDLSLTSELISLPTVDHVLLPEQDAVLILNPDGQLIWLDAEVAITRLAVDAEADHLLLSPNREWLLTWGDAVELWTVTDYEDMAVEPVHVLDIEVDGANFSPAGTYVVTWFDETLTVWNTETGQITATLADHRSGVSIIKWIDSEDRLLTVSNRGTGRYWRVSQAGVPSFSHWLVGEVDRIEVSPAFDTFITMRESYDARFYIFGNGQLRGNFPFTTQIVFSADWSLIASATGNLVTWYGREDDPRQFAWMPFGIADGLVNIRETPSDELPRISTFNNGDSVFVRGRTDDEQWLFVQLPDSSTGWILANRLRNVTGDVENLPVVDN